MPKRIAAALVLVILAGAGSGCGRAGSAINEIGLIYTGGVVEDKAYKGLLKPGATWNPVGWGSAVYRYRIDQRSLIAGPGGGREQGPDLPPVTVVSDDDVRLNVDFQLYFKLNREEKTLRKFHENLGVKTDAWTTEGWLQMLREYFSPQIERAMEAEALRYKWRDLFGKEDTRIEFQNATVTRLKDHIREVIGDDYFCGPAYNGPGSECGSFTFTVGKPTPVNEDIVRAVESEQTAVARTVAQEQENTRINKELEVERTLVALYGAQGALLREAIKSGKVTFMPIPPGTDIAVPAPTTR